MRGALPLKDVYFLDYVDRLMHPVEEGFVLNPEFNADGTHMNAGFMDFLSQTVSTCGCDLDSL